MAENHLIIIWNNALHLEEALSEKILSRVVILGRTEVRWSEDGFAKNLSRFYGENLPKNSHKERHCGIGVFVSYLVRDDHPQYEVRNTSKGPRIVNASLFDLKLQLREMTGGGHLVHATDTLEEVRYQTTALYGFNASNSSKLELARIPLEINADLSGHNGWDSFENLFSTLNEGVNYVVLRNYNNLDEVLDSAHPDIDILCDSPSELVRLINLRKVHRTARRAQFECKVADRSISFDIRYVGDNYYDSLWQRDILKNRRKHGYLYIPSEEDFIYSLLYHALIHKTYISIDYHSRLINALKFDELDLRGSQSEFEVLLVNYMRQKSYTFVEPFDYSVLFNERVVGKYAALNTSFTRKIVGKYLGLKLLIKRILNKLGYKFNLY